MSPNAKKIAVAAGVLFLLGVAVGFWRWQTMRARAVQPLIDELPQFVEPGAGPRSPSHELFGFRIGETTVTEARARVAELGIECQESGMRAMMARYRENKTKALMDKGQSPDEIASASWNRPSKRERNPQIRLSCEDVEGDLLDPRMIDGIRGRLLLVFDSEALPLRHVSYRRAASIASVEGIVADAAASAEHFTGLFGPPTTTTGELDATTFPTDDAAHRVTREWRFADLRAVVDVSKIARALMIDEVVEVPWPVRPDAPARE